MTEGADGLHVTVVDGETPPYPARLTGEASGVRLQRTDAPPPDPGLHLSPGWVDLHAHIYDGVTEISVRPDRVGLDQGVHLLGDAGSAGQATVRGLVEYVLPSARTPIRIWLNIGSHGLVHLRETSEPEFIDVDATLAAIDAHRAHIRGVKVRSSGLIVGRMGIVPLQLGRLVARTAGLPLLVHIGEPPPLIEDVLDLLDAGDVVTHCFHGKTGHPWHRDGTPMPALRRALDRGVLLDVGHGAASFDIDVARAAIAAGWAPHSISTDIHVRNIDGPVFDLATVMSKVLAAGLPLPEVIRAVTGAPRRILGEDEPAWTDGEGRVRQATLFRLAAEPPPGRSYRDAGRKVVEVTAHVVPAAVITDGRFVPLREEPTG